MDYYEAFAKYIANQIAKAPFEFQFDEDQDEEDEEDAVSYTCFGIEFGNGYKWIITAEFDPQTSYILNEKNVIVAKTDNWNK